MLTGMVLSILSGLVYILLRLPMMIVSLGMTLIYEAVAYWIVRSYAYGRATLKRCSLKERLLRSFAK